MARDLVHRAAEILHFWFDEVAPERRFVEDPGLDALCRQRFGDLRDDVFERAASGWRDSPAHLLAAIILLDQFSRNLFRDDPRAFEADPLARSLAREALAKGWASGLDPTRRQSLYLPLMHSEAMADQVCSLRLFEVLGEQVPFDYARRHAAQIARFGRFPQRNEVLGRPVTAAEAEFLSDPDARF